DVLQVVLDLGLRRVTARPARVWLERELVQMRRHIAGRAGIGVVVPHAADPLAALEDGHVLMARALEHHGRPDTAEAGADHDDRLRPASPAAMQARAVCESRSQLHRACQPTPSSRPPAQLGTSPLAISTTIARSTSSIIMERSI